jgi:hypothetical protein
LSADRSLSYAVTAAVVAPAELAFEYLSDPMKVGEWSLGSLETRRIANSDAYVGRSILDDSEAMFRIDADRARSLIDYSIGNHPARLVMRISIRILPGDLVEHASTSCIVTLTAWRPRSFDDARWSRLIAFHDAELHIIRARIERAFAARSKAQ